MGELTLALLHHPSLVMAHGRDPSSRAEHTDGNLAWLTALMESSSVFLLVRSVMKLTFEISSYELKFSALIGTHITCF